MRRLEPRPTLVRAVTIRRSMNRFSTRGNDKYMALIKIDERHKEIPQRCNETITPLDAVSLNIEQGEFISLMGASGTGKSTLLNLIASIDTPDIGSIYDRRHGHHSACLVRSWPIGAPPTWVTSFQTHNLVPVLTAYENIELPLLLLPMSFGERRKRIEVALKAVDLLDRADHYPRQIVGRPGAACGDRTCNCGAPQSRGCRRTHG